MCYSRFRLLAYSQIFCRASRHVKPLSDGLLTLRRQLSVVFTVIRCAQCAPSSENGPGAGGLISREPPKATDLVAWLMQQVSAFATADRTDFYPRWRR